MFAESSVVADQAASAGWEADPGRWQLQDWEGPTLLAWRPQSPEYHHWPLYKVSENDLWGTLPFTSEFNRLLDRFHGVLAVDEHPLAIKAHLVEPADREEPVKVVQARLRQASVKTTLDTYAHLWPDSDESTRTAIDGLVPGQLWIEIRNDNPPGSYVASTIMRNVRNAVLAELGIGDASELADKTWASAVLHGEVPEPTEAAESPEPQQVLRVVLHHLIDVGDLTIREVKLLASAAGNADWLDKPPQRCGDAQLPRRRALADPSPRRHLGPSNQAVRGPGHLPRVQPRRRHA